MTKILATLFIVTVLTCSASGAEPQAYDLLAGDWTRFSGAVPVKGGVEITPLDRKIRPRAGGGKWYFNPPVNLCGPRLDLTGDFQISAVIDNTKNPEKSAFLDFYGSIPICYDEWRIDGKNVRFGLKNGILEIWLNMKKQNFLKKGLSGAVEIGLSGSGGFLKFSVNGAEIGKAKDTVFTDSKIYFGADAEAGGGFLLQSLSACGSGVSIHDNYHECIRSYPVNPDSLRARASRLTHEFWIGTAGNVEPLMSDPQYGKTLACEFSMVTPEMCLKFQAVHPQEQSYAWAEADALVDFADVNGMRIHGHCLVWHEALPGWVWEIYANGKGDRDRMKSVMTEHITALVTRYKGKIEEWDLLNEIFSHDFQTLDANHPYGLRNGKEEESDPSVWFWAMGPSYILEAIRAARAADPACELWINEFGIDQASNSKIVDNVLSLIGYIESNGEKIDGVGFQAHNYDPEGDPSVASECLKNMARISAKGVKVRISELDVAGASKRPALFSDKLAVCCDFVKNPLCRSFGMWGFTDKYGSMSDPVNGGESGDNYSSPNWGAHYADSLLYDSSYHQKSAYQALLRVLQP
ncbi:MAG: endo-1,4-beta-xylanase [Candidatus Wallbacteria bacterium]|nr:endo-1,4-beta-xylanase [Candidatus Wallbacteria bacterium]